MDAFILAIDRAARTLSGSVQARRNNPAAGMAEAELSDIERQQSAALMRVNHAGEVAAQALYQGQMMFSRDAVLRESLSHAADEELDHLAWTRERVQALGGRTSVLDPLWYAGSFALGAVAAAIGDKVSLGFLQATEEQVEAHLEGHLRQLPAADTASRRVVEAMRQDEADHAQTARNLGAQPLPALAQRAMSLVSKVMTVAAAKI